ncbi:MAG TPA: GerW family sporulation protein [Candidatus Fimousia stercorigallinarum]|nr:GerW family sporulation protein [Candidatus Fimousia stercorigallinarum]
MSNKDLQSTVTSLFEGMDAFFSSKTVVGEPIHINDVIIVPLVDVTFGMGAGNAANGTSKKNREAGGLGGKMTPSAAIVIQNGQTKLVNIKNQDAVTKILDLVPDVIDRFKNGKNEPDISDDEVADMIHE